MGGASEEEVARWWRHCIYHVPACIKDLNPKAYRPQVVSLGPFHHGEAQLRPMDAHKRRALVHFLRRARRPLAEFAAAVAAGRRRRSTSGWRARTRGSAVSGAAPPARSGSLSSWSPTGASSWR